MTEEYSFGLTPEQQKIVETLKSIERSAGKSAAYNYCLNVLPKPALRQYLHLYLLNFLK